MFVLVKFKTIVHISPSELQKNINELVLNKLKTKIEGKCIKQGYIKKNSISIVKRSGGEVIKQHFNGNLCFNIVCNAEVCNPAVGTVLRCKVVAINHTAVKADYIYNGDVIIQFLIPKITAGIVSEIDLDGLKIGDDVNVEVYGGKKFKLNDTSINIIGRILKDKNTNADIATEQQDYIEEEDEPREDDPDNYSNDDDNPEDEEKEQSDEESEQDSDVDDDVDDIDDIADDIYDDNIGSDDFDNDNDFE